MPAENLSFLIAFGAGVISFLSPCILPIIPSFLSFLGGISYGQLAEQRVIRRAVFLKTLFFVLGFSMVFIALGVLFSSAALALGGTQTLIYRIAGAVVVFFGLNFIFDFWKALNMERRFHLRKRPQGALGAVLVGVAFGAGWTPCVGPILASILFLAGTSEKLGSAVALLALYSLGLGTPFLLAGAFFSSFSRQMLRVRPHLHAIKVASGVFLVALGALIFTGSFSRLNIALFGLAAWLEQWGARAPAGPKLLFGSIFLFLALLLAAFYARRVTLRVQASGTSPRKLLYPGRLALLLVFLAVSVLSFAKVVDLSRLISSWLRFQGI